MDKLQITTEDLPKRATIVVAKIKEKKCPFCNEIFDSIRELIKHLETKHSKEWSRWKKALPLSAQPAKGLYLVSPHGEMIVEGKKTLIIKKKRFNTEGKSFVLLEGKKALGIIILGKAVEIGVEDFTHLKKRHQISEEERKKWWGDAWPLFSYNFKFNAFKKPKDVKIPRGVQTFVDMKNVEFLSKVKEELIADWKSYNAMKLITTAEGRRTLADDHRIVHTWWRTLIRGKAMKSPQFKTHSLEEQKRIVRELHEKIVIAMDKLKWKHRSPLGAETLIASPSKIRVEDLEEVDEPYVQGLSDKELKVAYRRLHWLYHNLLKRITEPLHNAHVFVWKEIKRRNIKIKLVGDKLDKETRLEVVEYPKPEGAMKLENVPLIGADSIDRAQTLEEALEAFPDLIVLDEDPVHVHLCGRIVNQGKSPKGHDVDLLFKQGFPDERIIHSFVDEVSEKNKDLGRKLHFVWDEEGPQIGFSVPLYRLAYKKVNPEEMKRTDPHEYLAAWIKVMKPFRQLKPKSGFHKHEFFDVQEFWDKWASKNIEKGLVVQKKYDGMRFQVHVDGEKIKIITEDKQRDRSAVFTKSVKELMARKKVSSFVLDAEMVDYNCRGKSVKDMENVCEQFKREQMIPWITATKKPLDDENIVFHIHDCLFFKGEDIHEKGYVERWEAINKCFPPGLKHWRRVESTPATSVRSFFTAVKKERKRPGSEGVVVKIKDSPYKTTGRTADWAKLKNLKEIDVMVWDEQQKKTTKGTLLNQWIYYPVFKIPCGMKSKIRENQVIEYKGKCYAKLGRVYGTKERAKRGDIITVNPVQIVENEKDGKIWWTWMFPLFGGKKPEKKEPDTLETVRRIVKAGTAPLSESLAKTIKLPECSYWNDPLTCPLRSRFYIPKEALSDEKVLEEFLKFPIICQFANKMKCHFVKNYYYDLRYKEEPKEKDIQEMEED